MVVSSSDIWVHGDECYLDDNISAAVFHVLYIGLLCSTWQCLLSSFRDMKSFTIQHLTLIIMATVIINAVSIALVPKPNPLPKLIIEEAQMLLNVVRKIQNMVYFFLPLIINWDSCFFQTPANDLKLHVPDPLNYSGSCWVCWTFVFLSVSYLLVIAFFCSLAVYEIYCKILHFF